MKKIPTLFERDWNGDISRVLNQVHVGCEWVLAGEGVPTRKLDGTSCMIRENRLFKRRELKGGQVAPVDFEEIGFDDVTNKLVGWVPVSEGSEDRWHREAFDALKNARSGWQESALNLTPDGTYELVGPKVQGNPEQWPTHALVPHSDGLLKRSVLDAPRTFDELREWLSGRDIEGLVFHHPDGRMAKIKLRDFGLKRGQF